MKLLLLLILFCGINVMPSHTAKPKKTCVRQTHTKEVASFDIVPSGILFQF